MHTFFPHYYFCRPYHQILQLRFTKNYSRFRVGKPTLLKFCFWPNSTYSPNMKWKRVVISKMAKTGLQMAVRTRKPHSNRQHCKSLACFLNFNNVFTAMTSTFTVFYSTPILWRATTLCLPESETTTPSTLALPKAMATVDPFFRVFQESCTSCLSLMISNSFPGSLSSKYTIIHTCFIDKSNNAESSFMSWLSSSNLVTPDVVGEFCNTINFCNNGGDTVGRFIGFKRDNKFSIRAKDRFAILTANVVNTNHRTHPEIATSIFHKPPFNYF